MRKIFSTRYNPGAFNTALLVLRLGFGVLIAYHGYQKLEHFDEYKLMFVNFMGIGSPASLGLVIFAELFCGILVVLGLFTRFACIVLVISCTVALIKGHQWDVTGKGEMVTLYLTAFIALLFTGAGKASVDNMISK